MSNETENVIPIIDCPACGALDVPLSHNATMAKKGKPDIEIWSCSECGKVPNVAADIKVKRWISIADLKAMGYSQD